MACLLRTIKNEEFFGKRFKNENICEFCVGFLMDKIGCGFSLENPIFPQKLSFFLKN
jgi:hypothetical protein